MIIQKFKFHNLIRHLFFFVFQDDQVESSKCMLNAKDEEYLVMVTGRDKELRTLSCRLSKLQNEFADSVRDSVRKAHATISELKVNESKGYLYNIRVTLIYILLSIFSAC